MNTQTVAAGSTILPNGTYRAMERILNSPHRPTAVFCATDMFAISAMKCAKNHGLSIPNDISFIGINDIIISEYVEPALTTVHIDKKEMGAKAIDILVEKINGREAPSVILPSGKLVERDSVADINKTR